MNLVYEDYGKTWDEIVRAGVGVGLTLSCTELQQNWNGELNSWASPNIQNVEGPGSQGVKCVQTASTWEKSWEWSRW